MNLSTQNDINILFSSDQNSNEENIDDSPKNKIGLDLQKFNSSGSSDNFNNAVKNSPSKLSNSLRVMTQAIGQTKVSVNQSSNCDKNKSVPQKLFQCLNNFSLETATMQSNMSEATDASCFNIVALRQDCSEKERSLHAFLDKLEVNSVNIRSMRDNQFSKECTKDQSSDLQLALANRNKKRISQQYSENNSDGSSTNFSPPSLMLRRAGLGSSKQSDSKRPNKFGGMPGLSLQVKPRTFSMNENIQHQRIPPIRAFAPPLISARQRLDDRDHEGEKELQSAIIEEPKSNSTIGDQFRLQVKQTENQVDNNLYGGLTQTVEQCESETIDDHTSASVVSQNKTTTTSVDNPKSKDIADLQDLEVSPFNHADIPAELKVTTPVGSSQKKSEIMTLSADKNGPFTPSSNLLQIQDFTLDVTKS